MARLFIGIDIDGSTFDIDCAPFSCDAAPTITDASADSDAGPGQGMVSGDRLFSLIQVHFHTPSEHAIDGERYPLTAHFVHATRDGTLGVLGVMFEEGEENEGLQTIIDAMPNGDGSAISIDMGAMVPDDLAVYRYMGSLTTIEASPEQIAAFEGALEMSARSLQPLNNRLLVAPAD